VSAALLVSAFVSLMYAETSTVTALRAAFLYNFVRFIEWPPDALAPGQTIALCVVGDQAVANALDETILGRTIEGHGLSVSIVKPDGPVRSCHLLYFGALDGKQSAGLLESVKGAAVFTVGNTARFAEVVGVGQLIRDDDQLRFAINITSAQRARLRLSSQLLSLATIVKDQPNAQR
jgi:hypothetical protein